MEPGSAIRARETIGVSAMHRIVTVLGMGALVGLASGSLRAQDDVPLDRFSVQSFWAAAGPADAWMVESPRVGSHMTPTVGLSIDYAHEPFVVVRCTSETNCDLGDRASSLVRSLATAQFYASVALLGRFQVGLSVPLGFRSGDAFAFSRGGRRYELPGGSQFGPGDPRLSFKARLWHRGTQHRLALGASAFLGGPLGQQVNQETFLSDPGFSFGASLLGSYRSGSATLLVNLGGLWREQARLFSTEIGPRLTYGVAAAYRLPTRLEVLAELTGNASMRAQLDENPLEGRLGVRYPVGEVLLSLAGGGGLIAGAGTPAVRLLAAARWAPSSRDTDGDGIEDADDACPADPEDRDGVEDEDGCPEGDTDGDGIEDEQDRCPDQPEDPDDFEDEDGCPDPDNDGDGVRDGFDSCPNQPEDRDGDRDEDGCPDNDTDRDGIEDAQDRCPKRPEDVDGFADLDGCPERDVDLDGIDDTEDECPEQPERFDGVQDEDGCPEPDGDGDGISDARDRCPEEAESYNGKKDDDGCPDGSPLLERTDDGIRILAPIRFRGEQPARALREALRAAATILKRERHHRYLDVALVAPGVPVEQAQARVRAVLQALQAAGAEVEPRESQPIVEGEGEPRLMLRYVSVTPGEDDDWVPPSDDEPSEAESTAEEATSEE